MRTLRNTSWFFILSALLLLPGAAATPARADAPRQQGGWGQPQQPQQGGWGQPQQPQQGGWGQPQKPQQGAWGQPQQPQQGGWGQPQQPQQGGWGQPQQPQQGGWGQPQQPQQGGRGQPQQPRQDGWGQAQAAPGPLEGRWVWFDSSHGFSIGFTFSGNRFASWITGGPEASGTYTVSGSRLIMHHETGPDAGKTDNLAFQLNGNQLYIGVSPGQPPIVFTRR